MLQSLRHIKSRIRSIESTRKLTHAMEMVSIAKLKRTQSAFEKSGKYTFKVEALLKSILSSDKMISHPFLDERLDKKNVLLCVITSDTGLCGPYNHNVIRAAETFLKNYQPDTIRLVTVGKKGFIHFNRKNFKVVNSYVGLNGRYSPKICEGMLNILIDMFLSKQADEVYIAYTHPETASRRKPVIEKLLNIVRLPGAKPVDYIYETPISSILDDLIPMYLSNKIKTIMLDSFTSEHQARAIAMGEATENATDLLSGLILMRNKVRQANITKEMLEIISSAEALKG